MLDNLDSILNRYYELETRLSLPETYEKPELYVEYDREMRELKPVADEYRIYCSLKDELLKNEELLEFPDFKELAAEECRRLRNEIQNVENNIKVLLLPKDPDADRNVIMEIRSGVGGEESALFVSDLYRMYSMYAEKKGWSIQPVYEYETDLGGLKEISFIVEGTGAYSKLKYEAGGHRVQRIPVTESGGRIHTSAATVAVLPEVPDVDFVLNMSDVKIDTYRSSGAGGQHVNKTESAIRVTHIPTGTVVECQDERSQYKNKDRALSILRSKLYESEKEKSKNKLDAERKEQVGSGDRSQRIRTYNFPQNRVTDHRLTGEIKNFNIDNILNGNLDSITDILISEERTRQLQKIAD